MKRRYGLARQIQEAKKELRKWPRWQRELAEAWLRATSPQSPTQEGEK